MSANDEGKSEVIPADITPPEESPDRRRQCHKCGAMVDRLAAYCPKCDAQLPITGHSRRSERGRRYVYGKRKTPLSQEAIWLIVVIIVGLLIVFGVQVLAFMRAKKLMMAPPMPRQMIARSMTSSAPDLRPIYPTRPTGPTFTYAYRFSTEYREVVPDDQVHQLLVVPQWHEARAADETRQGVRV